MSGRSTVLIVEARREVRHSLVEVLRKEGRHLAWADSRVLALKAMALNPVAVIVTAPSLPDGNWCDFISQTTEEPSAPNVIVVSTETQEPSESEAMQLGAYAVLAGPEAASEVLQLVDTAVDDWERRRRPMQRAMCTVNGSTDPAGSGT